MLNGAELIALQRSRHEGKGYTSEHDDKHDKAELAIVASYYLHSAKELVNGTTIDEIEDAFDLDDESFPWDKRDFKPSSRPIGNLVEAGALIAAEIDRLQRLK